jgi:hypothetical protein
MKNIIILLISLPISTTMLAGTYSGGSGTSGDPYQIAIIADLIELSNTSGDWDKDFIQTADITFNADETQVDWDGDGSANWDIEDQKGFSPIGNSTTKFIGIYNGQEYSISNLFIDRTDTLGLFGYIGEGSGTDKGNITNLNLVDVEVNATHDHIGGLAAYQDVSSSVENVHISGTIVGSDSSNYAGGLIGEVFGAVTNCSFDGEIIGEFHLGGLIGGLNGGDVTTSHSSGTVKAHKDNVGGLIGRMSSGTVSNSYSTSDLSLRDINDKFIFDVGGFVGKVLDGTISQCYSQGNALSFRDRVGGFVGRNRGEIYNCYSRGNVSGNNGASLTRLGGFVGWNERGKVINCYSTGAVTYDDTSNPTNKGFAGAIDSNGSYEMTDNFWDTQTSGQTTTSGDATGKTTAEMKDFATYTDETTVGLTTAWDFVTNPNDDAGTDDYWDMDQQGTVNDAYPILSWQDGADMLLPVRWLSFDGERISENVVELNWSTASELNNDQFEIQRSKSGRDFATIGMLNGAGNSYEVVNYQFQDDNAPKETVYYRLKQIDYDGRYEYSEIIVIHKESNLQTGELSIYPNPVSGTVNLKFPKYKGDMQLEVLDMSGLKIYTKQVSGKSSMSINTQQWPEGVYMVIFKNRNILLQQRIIVL